MCARRQRSPCGADFAIRRTAPIRGRRSEARRQGRREGVVAALWRALLGRGWVATQGEARGGEGISAWASRGGACTDVRSLASTCWDPSAVWIWRASAQAIVAGPRSSVPCISSPSLVCVCLSSYGITLSPFPALPRPDGPSSRPRSLSLSSLFVSAPPPTYPPPSRTVPLPVARPAPASRSGRGIHAALASALSRWLNPRRPITPLQARTPPVSSPLVLQHVPLLHLCLRLLRKRQTASRSHQPPPRR